MKNFRFFSISKIFEKSGENKFRIFFEFKKIENFSLKIEWKWKILRSKIFDFFGSKFFRTLWGPKQTVRLEILIFLPQIKTWWKLWSSSFHKYVVSLCSGAIEAVKVYIYFRVTAKPMNTPYNLDICPSFVKSHYTGSFMTRGGLRGGSSRIIALGTARPPRRRSFQL